VDGLILDGLPTHDADIGVGPSRASSQDAKHTHAKNVVVLDSDDYVV
jgi:hypothetical protein